MQDKIRLLMDETGCDQGEAELALQAANYDLEVAVKTIGSILRNFEVIKSKFIVHDSFLYGLLLIIINTKRKELQRTRAVISYNPALYEIAMTQDWYEFEKDIYGFRLSDGIVPSATQEVERFVTKFLAVKENDMRDAKQLLQNLLNDYFHSGITVETLQEGINLEQYHKPRQGYDELVSGSGEGSSHAKFDSTQTGNTLTVQVQLDEDANGRIAENLIPGDTVYPTIVDQRDIANYLSRLLGGRIGDRILPLPTPIENVVRDGENVKLFLRLASGIIGVANVNRVANIKASCRLDNVWWKQLLPRLA